MGRDQDVLACLDLGHDDVVPVRQRALDGQLERLKERELFLGRFAGVARIVHDDFVKLAGLVERRRRHVEAAAPNLNLRQHYNRSIATYDPLSRPNSTTAIWEKKLLGLSKRTQ